MSREFLLDLLDRGIVGARIALVIDGQRRTVGDDSLATEDCAVVLRIHHQRFFDRVVSAGNLGMAESYMDGEFEVIEGTLAQYLEILLRSKLDHKIKATPAVAVRVLILRLVDYFKGKAHNVQRHYDIGDELFDTFLDPTLTYSCGYVGQPDDDLATLQHNKLDRICRKLELQPGDRLLDIGCGFGGLLIHAARDYGVQATGVTISHRHCERGNQAIADQGLAERAEIRYADFTELEGTYDKVVSVGMMEHVPRPEYNRYFARIADLLTPEGRGLVHTVGANAAKNEHDPFIQKYIFPLSGQPRLSEIAAGLETHGLAILDVENLIRHYAYTAQRWLENFRAHHHQLDDERFDERFKRMWIYYLSCCVAAGYASDSALYQVLFTKNHAAELRLHRV